MNKVYEYNYDIGKSMQQIMAEIGNQFNDYHSNIWNCHIKTNFLGKKTVLILFFEDEKVYKIRVRKTYGKIKT
ncbi:hypothetical protein HHL23_20725 [Chryseobacterium sp. RP-3-3]|uniref:Uncharacterized protein n=1 Tax=Chryseobacterium antibioticum TaxID=2728847 RepID=A0A7Y0FTB4_9FLAO|nr:hypothetical protein [Chryseobacterium antibioticum]NML72192.1 hypothetical protein [Chryseobacterium antibioticum]